MSDCTHPPGWGRLTTRVFVLVISALLTAAVWAGATPLEPKADASSAAQDQDYTGVEKCSTPKCHDVEVQGYRESLHSREWNARSPAADRGCETCHGPGRKHDEDVNAKGLIRNFSIMAPRDVSEVCMSCHNGADHAEYQGGKHDMRNVSCVDCHSNHTPKAEDGRLKGTTDVDTCAPCHRDKAAKMQLASHMPVREAKMGCSTCHAPHGSTNVKNLRDGNSVVEACTGCHPEKRGPFLFEHAPVHENCATCHDPHGSSNDRMLVAKQPMICQRCHIHSRHPATIYDATAALVSRDRRVIGRSCMNCHPQIHGSSSPSGQVFTR